VCALVHVAGDTGEEHTFIGECRGRVAAAPAGSGGFGYDPAFVPDAVPERTMAELGDEEKDAISHRGEAVRALLRWLDP
jgi:XTP/dITP diphosphohydrolase